MSKLLWDVSRANGLREVQDFLVAEPRRDDCVFVIFLGDIDILDKTKISLPCIGILL